MEWTSISVERLINGYRTFNFFLRGLPRLERAFDDKTFHKLFIKWSKRMGDKEQHLMQMWLCTTIITNISWFRHVFAGRPAVRGPASMLTGLWQHKLRVIWWLIKWQSNTCMDYEIAAWMGLVSSPRWMEMKEMKCNFSFSLQLHNFGAPAHKSQFIQLLFMKTKFWPAIAIVPFHLKFRSLARDFNSICTTIWIQFPLRRPREWKRLLISMRSENNFAAAAYRHMGAQRNDPTTKGRQS